MRLVEPTAGSIRFEGVELTKLRGEELRRRRRGLQMIFQDPFGSLSPRMTVAQTLGEALEIHGLARGREARGRRVAKLLEAVGLSPLLRDRYPHEFSGGQRQRVSIARALAVEPKLIVCDEPVSALDVSVQAQIVNLLRELQAARGLAYLFIAHDLAVVRHLSHRILVMYLGRIVEAAAAARLVASPAHPYTQALLAAVPRLDPDSKLRSRPLGGETPSPLAPPVGCAFHPRCPLAETRCRLERPVLREASPGHQVACHLAG
jgi:oligopeptide/dipeptide ABC transporter ATP-binding protein